MAKYWDKQVARSRKISEGFKAIVRTEAEKAKIQEEARKRGTVKTMLKELTKKGIGVRVRDGKFYERVTVMEEKTHEKKLANGLKKTWTAPEPKVVETELPEAKTFEDAVVLAFAKATQYNEILLRKGDQAQLLA